MISREKPHKKLDLWQKTMDFVIQIYDLTKRFPREEEFGLKAQLRRAAVSVPSNISEGLTRRTTKEKLHFLNIAQSSLSEIDAQLEITQRLGLIVEAEIEKTYMIQTDVEKLLSGLIWSLRG